VRICCYVGVLDTTRLVRARFVHRHGHPTAIVPALARIWATPTARDTTGLIRAVLAHDWAYLDPDPAPPTTKGLCCRLVPGVGVPAHDRTGNCEPAARFPLWRAADLDAAWVYLIHPHDDTVAVHSDDGDLTGTYPLRA
jgi:hypothetical protein